MSEIFHIECGRPPKGCTLQEWREWRAAEDSRMLLEAMRQIFYFAELKKIEPEDGAVPH